jgi:hypothetical protein
MAGEPLVELLPQLRDSVGITQNHVGATVVGRALGEVGGVHANGSK